MFLLSLWLAATLRADGAAAPVVDGSRTVVLSWKYEAVPLRFPKDWTLDDALRAYKEERLQPEDPAVFARGRVELSFEPFQFVMIEESCEPWTNGDAAYISTSGAQFYDGSALLYWSADAHGQSPPSIEFQRNRDGEVVAVTTNAGVDGVATTSPRESLMNYPRLAPLTGIDWLLRIDPLQDFRKTAFDLRQLSDVTDSWKADAASKNSWSVESQSADGDYLETDYLDFDSESGLLRSVIRQTTRVASKTDNRFLSVGDSRIFRRAMAVAENVGTTTVESEGQAALLAHSRYFPPVLPYEVVIVTEQFGLGHGYYITLSEISVAERPLNWVRPYVPVDSLITDLETRETSQIIRSYRDDADHVAAFLKANRVATVPPGEIARPEGDRAKSSVSILLWVHAIGLLVLLAGVAWKWRSTSAKAITLLALLGSGLHAGESGNGTLSSDSAGESPMPGASALTTMASKADVIAIPSCGYRATICVCELTQTDYDPRLIAEMINVRQRGVRLADIHRTLVAHGLRSDIRKHVRTKELYDALRVDELLLMPVAIDEQLTKHYVIVLREDLTTVLVVNPGVVVHRCASANELFDSLNRADDIMGLLVTRRPTPRGNEGISSRIEVRRESDNMDEESESGILPVRYSLTNTSEEVVVCSRVQPSCGCVSTETGGWLLEPKESRLVEGRFADGKYGDQSIELSFPDGSDLVLEIPVVRRTSADSSSAALEDSEGE